MSANPDLVIPVIRCPACGSIHIGVKFCVECGATATAFVSVPELAGREPFEQRYSGMLRRIRNTVD